MVANKVTTARHVSTTGDEEMCESEHAFWNINHSAFFLASLASPFLRILMHMPRRTLSIRDSGRMEIKNHRTECGQYGVHLGSYPMWRTAAQAYVSADGTMKEDFLMDAIFVATYRGTWIDWRSYWVQKFIGNTAYNWQDRCNYLQKH